MRVRPIFDWLNGHRSESRQRLFPRLGAADDKLPFLRDADDQAGWPPNERVAMLEAKVEYPLDELHRLKSYIRSLLLQSSAIAGMHVSDICRDSTVILNSIKSGAQNRDKKGCGEIS